MKTPDSLSTLLKTWRHAPPPAPDFSSSVWTRIRASEQAPPSASAPVLRFPVPLPLAAGFALLLAGLAGAGAGLVVNREHAADRMAAAYVRSIDPLQMTAMTAPHSHS